MRGRRCPWRRDQTARGRLCAGRDEEVEGRVAEFGWAHLGADDGYEDRSREVTFRRDFGGVHRKVAVMRHVPCTAEGRQFAGFRGGRSHVLVKAEGGDVAKRNHQDHANDGDREPVDPTTRFTQVAHRVELTTTTLPARRLGRSLRSARSQEKPSSGWRPNWRASQRGPGPCA